MQVRCSPRLEAGQGANILKSFAMQTVFLPPIGYEFNSALTNKVKTLGYHVTPSVVFTKKDDFFGDKHVFLYKNGFSLNHSLCIALEPEKYATASVW